MLDDIRQSEIKSLVKLVSSDPVVACNAIKDILPCLNNGPSSWKRIHSLAKLLYHFVLMETIKANKHREAGNPDTPEDEKDEQDYLWKMFISNFLVSMAPSVLYPYILKNIVDDLSNVKDKDDLCSEIKATFDELIGKDWDKDSDDKTPIPSTEQSKDPFSTGFNPSLN